MGAPIKLYRLYAGDDGQSHFEPLDTSAASPLFDNTHRVKGLLFRKEYAPHIVNWHRDPRRRWVITLSGAVDIGIGDGTAITFGPGDAFLAEDVTGQGHTATPHNWVRAYVDLDGALGIPVILITGHSELLADKGLRNVPCFTKPFNLYDLLHKTRELIG